MQSFTSCVQAVRGVCFLTTSPTGKLFTIISAAWRKDGTWQQIHERLRLWVRVSQNREPSPSEAIIDSQSLETANFGV